MQALQKQLEISSKITSGNLQEEKEQMERKRDQIIEYNNSLLESITHLEDEKVGLESQLKELREEI